MSPERWERIEELFNRAAELDSRRRDDLLSRECQEDSLLRREVLALLDAHDASAGPLDRSALIGPAFARGQTVSGRFRIEEFLNRGGMGEVYRAVNLETAATVALKTLASRYSTNGMLKMRFEREVELMRRIDHPHVCRIQGVGTENSGGVDTPYFAMDFLEGETLAECLKRDGRMAPAKVLPLVRQMVDALEAMSSAGVVHRDLKPSNIMLTPSGDDVQVVIMDLGLARQLPSEPQTKGLTSPSLIMGTPAYMAPEQCLNEKVGPFTDVYALAVVTYEMLTGRVPFQGDTPIRVMLRKFSEAPPPPTEVVADLDEWWDHFVLRCMERDVRARVQSPQEVLLLLDQFGQDRAPPSPRPRAAVESPSPPHTVVEERDSNAFRLRRLLVVAATVGLASGALALSSASVRGAAAVRLCDWMPGSAMFCEIPVDRDLAILPFEVVAESPGDRALATGLERFLSVSLKERQANQEAYCIHVTRRSGGSAEDLVMRGAISIVDGIVGLEFGVELAETGRLLRSGRTSGPVADLEFLHAELVSKLAEGVEYELAIGRAPPRNAAAFRSYLEGLGYLELGNAEAAVQSFFAAVKADFSYAPSHVGLADAHRLRQEPGAVSSARNTYDRALGLDPALKQAHVGLGRLALSTEGPQAAAAHFRRALEIDPDDFEIQRNLANAYLALDSEKRAIEVLNTAAERRPRCYLAPNFLAGIGNRIADYKMSERFLMEVVKRAPRNAMAHANLAMVYINQGRYRDAVQAAADAVQYESLSLNYSTLGRAYGYLGCEEASLINLVHATTREDYGLAASLMNLAEAYEADGDRDREAHQAFARAAALYRERLAAEPDDSEARTNLALCLARTSTPTETRDQIEIALLSSPDSRQTLLSAAVVYEILADRNTALSYLRKALEARPGGTSEGQGRVSVLAIEQRAVLSQLRADPRYSMMLSDLALDPAPNPGSASPSSDPCPVGAEPGNGFPEWNL